jgi:hypothetical protein
MGTASVYAAIATVIQKHLCKLENGLNEIHISIIVITKLCKSLASLVFSRLRAFPGT